MRSIWRSGRSSKRKLSPEVLEGFRSAQKLAYRSVTAVAEQLYEGISEREAASKLGAYLKSEGVERFFHTPFAWFGERSKFSGFTGPNNFLPTDRKLKTNEVFILDVAPIVNGFTADVGYTSSIIPSEELEKAQSDLRTWRKEIPVLFESLNNREAIWNKVDEWVREKGYENCHKKYPFSVLAHKVREIRGWLPNKRFPFWLMRWFPFDVQWSFLQHGLFPELLGPKSKGSLDGLWAVEPHVGASSFGAKFEEILVVQAGEARWLDDDVPHV